MSPSRIFLAASTLACVAAAGCNAIFGIVPADTSPLAAGGSGSGGDDVDGAAPAPAACPPERIPLCHTDGSATLPCDPFPVSPVDKAPIDGIAVVGDHVYWGTETGSIASARYDGTGGDTFGLGMQSAFVVASPTEIYWTDLVDPKIRGASLAAGHKLFDVSAMVGIAPRGHYGHITRKNGMLYWVGENPSAVWAAKADGSQPKATKVAYKTDSSSNLLVSTGIAADETYVYWSDNDKVRRFLISELGNDVMPDDLMTYVAPTNYGASAGEVVVDETYVYWTYVNGVAWERKAGAGASVLNYLELTTADAGPRSLLIDGDYLYVSLGSGSILRTKRGGDMATDPFVLVATGPTTNAYGLAADCGAIYWSTYNTKGTGTVYRVRKP